MTCLTVSHRESLFLYCPHSMQSKVYVTVQCLSILSVCLCQHGPTAANLLLQVCCCGPGGQEILINGCSSGVQQANAGSATLSVYIGWWILLNTDLTAAVLCTCWVPAGSQKSGGFVETTETNRDIARHYCIDGVDFTPAKYLMHCFQYLHPLPAHKPTAAQTNQSHTHTHTHTRLTAFCPGLPG